MIEDKLKVISLFSGYGTQELALKYINANFETIANCDILTSANMCYDALHQTKLGNLGDIKSINEKGFPPCDLLTYSFPCQDISIAGIQKGIKKGTRSGLLFEVERIVGHNKPKFLLMENVKNLISKKHIDNFQTHIDYLKSLGYSSYWRVLNGADFGCPQNRERVFMMSVLDSNYDFVKNKMLGVDDYKKAHKSMREFIDDVYDEKLIIDCQFTLYLPKRTTICKLVGIRTDISYEQASRIYSIDACSPCLTTSGSPQILLDNGVVRKLTTNEAYRFMGVKEGDINLLNQLNLTNKTHVALAGNSICVPVMEAIFRQFFSDYIQ